jgi:hypothetical protein
MKIAVGSLIGFAVLLWLAAVVLAGRPVEFADDGFGVTNRRQATAAMPHLPADGRLVAQADKQTSAPPRAASVAASGAVGAGDVPQAKEVSVSAPVPPSAQAFPERQERERARMVVPEPETHQSSLAVLAAKQVAQREDAERIAKADEAAAAYVKNDVGGQLFIRHASATADSTALTGASGQKAN